jgi:hypothetical protein
MKPEIRFGQNGTGYINASRIWSAIQEFGWDNIDHSILFTTTDRTEAALAELRYIREFDSCNPEHGYNSYKRSLGKPMRAMPALAGFKISKSKRGTIGINKDGVYRYVQPDQLDTFLSDGWQRGGRPLTQLQKQHLSDVNLGKQYSDETKRKLSEMRTGKIVVHKGDDVIRISPEMLAQYQAEGWVRGASEAWKDANRQSHLGTVQSEETKRIRSESMKGVHKGKKQIHKDGMRKLVAVSDLDTYLADGWALGVGPRAKPTRR